MGFRGIRLGSILCLAFGPLLIFETAYGLGSRPKRPEPSEASREATVESERRRQSAAPSADDECKNTTNQSMFATTRSIGSVTATSDYRVTCLTDCGNGEKLYYIERRNTNGPSEGNIVRVPRGTKLDEGFLRSSATPTKGIQFENKNPDSILTCTHDRSPQAADNVHTDLKGSVLCRGKSISFAPGPKILDEDRLPRAEQADVASSGSRVPFSCKLKGKDVPSEIRLRKLLFQTFTGTVGYRTVENPKNPPVEVRWTDNSTCYSKDGNFAVQFAQNFWAPRASGSRNDGLCGLPSDISGSNVGRPASGAGSGRGEGSGSGPGSGTTEP